MLKKITLKEDDGRTDEPLLPQVEFEPGEYEIFSAAEYFEEGNPPLLGRVSIRFGISDPDSHCQVPLLASPWSYSTCRGS